jgi:hypothetical protein
MVLSFLEMMENENIALQKLTLRGARGNLLILIFNEGASLKVPH